MNTGLKANLPLADTCWDFAGNPIKDFALNAGIEKTTIWLMEDAVVLDVDTHFMTSLIGG